MYSFAKRQLTTLKNELLVYTRREKLFLFFATLCSFFICLEYAVVRPVANSLFIEKFGANAFPWAWLALVPVNFVFVHLYNRLVPKWGSPRLFICFTGLVITLNCTFAATNHLLGAPFTFLFYMWKEVYILMIFQLVWSVIHTNVKLAQAKYLYGVFFGFGGCGSMVGSAFPGFFAVSCGTATLLYLTLPVYGLLLLSYWRMSLYGSGEAPHHQREGQGGVLHGMRLIRRSRFLIFALILVLFMQMIAAITDFQLNDFLAKTFPDTDIRTQQGARIMGIIHILTVALQFIGTYFLIQVIGFQRLHYLIPILIGLPACVVLLAPAFPAVGLGFITCKTLDFSVFNVIKEMLYVPLQPDEKFRAKAVIDVFAYRASKALIAFVIIGLTTFLNSAHLSWITLVLSVLWIISVSLGLKGYDNLKTAGEA